MPIKDPKKQRKELFKAVTVMCQFDGMKIAKVQGGNLKLLQVESSILMCHGRCCCNLKLELVLWSGESTEGMAPGNFVGWRTRCSPKSTLPRSLPKQGMTPLCLVPCLRTLSSYPLLAGTRAQVAPMQQL